jgi:hypothetical protein
MALPFNKLLARLELPANDWVLSRFGSLEAPTEASAAPLGEPSATTLEESPPVAEEPAAPSSQWRVRVAARLFDHWFGQEPAADAADAADTTAPPQSGERTSPNASTYALPEIAKR